MTHTQGKLTVVDGHYPSFINIKGLSFEVSIVVSASDIDFDQSIKRQEDARHLVACWNACTAMRTKDVEELAEFGNGVMQLIVKATDAITERDELLQQNAVFLDAAKKAIRSLNELVVDDSEKAPAIQGARMRKQNAVRALGAAIKKAGGKV